MVQKVLSVLFLFMALGIQTQAGALDTTDEKKIVEQTLTEIENNAKSFMQKMRKQGLDKDLEAAMKGVNALKPPHKKIEALFEMAEKNPAMKLLSKRKDLLNDYVKIRTDLSAKVKNVLNKSSLLSNGLKTKLTDLDKFAIIGDEVAVSDVLDCTATGFLLALDELNEKSNTIVSLVSAEIKDL